MITFTFENGAVCTLRGSGTEPKLKFYVEAKGATREEMQDTLSSVTTAVSSAIMLAMCAFDSISKFHLSGDRPILAT